MNERLPFAKRNEGLADLQASEPRSGWVGKRFPFQKRNEGLGDLQASEPRQRTGGHSLY